MVDKYDNNSFVEIYWDSVISCRLVVLKVSKIPLHSSAVIWPSQDSVCSSDNCDIFKLFRLKTLNVTRVYRFCFVHVLIKLFLFGKYLVWVCCYSAAH